MNARGDFEVEMTPADSREGPGATLARMTLEKRWTGDVVGSSSGEMLSAVTTVKGSAGYVAVERFTGHVHGRAGSFTLQHSGTMDRGAPSLRVTVVPDSGTDELAGIAGTLDIVIDADGHHYLFEYALAEGD